MGLSPLLINLRLIKTYINAKIETYINAKIAILRSNNGWEFLNNTLHEFLSSKGIVHQSSCAYTLQQNEVAELKNHHLIEVARSLMLSTSFPSYL